MSFLDHIPFLRRNAWHSPAPDVSIASERKMLRITDSGTETPPAAPAQTAAPAEGSASGRYKTLRDLRAMESTPPKQPGSPPGPVPAVQSGDKQPHTLPAPRHRRLAEAQRLHEAGTNPGADLSTEDQIRRRAFAKALFDKNNDAPVSIEGDFSPHVGVKKINPKVKGFLTGTFTSAAAMGTAKLAFNTAIRTFDATGIGVALGTGGWNSGREMIRDYRKARAIVIDGEQMRRLAAFRSIWTIENSKKYGAKFLKGSAVGLIGVGIADLSLEHADALKEWFKPVRDFTAPVTKFLSPIGEWFSNLKQSISNWFSDKFSFKPMTGGIAPNPKNTPLPGDVPATTSTPAPSLKAPSVSAATNENVIQLPDVIVHPDSMEITPSAAPAATPSPDVDIIPISAREQLEELAGKSAGRPGTIEKALHGTAWAQNEVIDGLNNGRFGFAQDHELAKRWTEQLAEPLKAKLEAGQALSPGEEDILLKHAYFEYNPKHPQESLEIVRKIGRSWYGAPELMQKFQDANGAQIFVPATSPDLAAITDTEAREAMSCKLVEIKPLSFTDPDCTPGKASFVAGNTIGLDVVFNNHAPIHEPLVIGPNAAKMTSVEYARQAIASAMPQIINNLPPQDLVVAR